MMAGITIIIANWEQRISQHYQEWIIYTSCWI